MKNKGKIFFRFLLIFLVIAALNFVGDRFFVRLDFTQGKQYTLSKATKSILKNLDEPVTITAYFTGDLPSDIAKSKRDFKELLTEYSKVSRNKVLYEFTDPNKDPEVEQQAVQSGVQPVLVNVREKDQVKQQKVYLGVKIQYGEKTGVIPVLQPGGAMEYELSTTIKRISMKEEEKKTVGILQGHGEPSPQAMQQVLAEMMILYNVEPVQLSDSALNLMKYKTIMIVAPSDTFPPDHLAKLDAYLAEGGNLFIAMNRVAGDFQTLQGNSVETGLSSWLSQKNILVDNAFLVDASCATVGVTQQQSFFRYTTQIPFPFLPIVKKFADQPATRGLEAVILHFPSPIMFAGDSVRVKYTPLIQTSEKTGKLAAPVMFDIQKQWTENDFPIGPQTVAALFSGRLAGERPSKIILITDGDFMVSGEPQQGQRPQLQKDNVNLASNSVDWLSDDTGLIDLRTKGITARLLDEVSDGKKIVLKWLNFLLPIAIIIIYGLLRIQFRRNQRNKRMEGQYV